MVAPTPGQAWPKQQSDKAKLISSGVLSKMHLTGQTGSW